MSPIKLVRKVVTAVRTGNWRPLRKIGAGALSGLTATGVVAYGDTLGWDISQGWAGLLAAAATVLAGYLVPERTAAR